MMLDRQLHLQKVEARIDVLAEELNEATAFSWLWCLLLGPIWFLYIGHGKAALTSFLLALVTLGLSQWVVWVFAYQAHRTVARRKALTYITAGLV